MDILLVPTLLLVKTVVGLAIMTVVADVVLGWLLGANILGNNRFLFVLVDAISKLSNLMLNPIRRNIPCTVGMLDLSPVILILLLSFAENMVMRILIRLA
ncbi:MAG: YggT family protein [Holosporaceae bacterium]|jgi:YggT family protein|nr:YggT family protein [Holosporaceae bacterium]